jgi:hypothetical protein
MRDFEELALATTSMADFEDVVGVTGRMIRYEALLTLLKKSHSSVPGDTHAHACGRFLEKTTRFAEPDSALIQQLRVRVHCSDTEDESTEDELAARVMRSTPP